MAAPLMRAAEPVMLPDLDSSVGARASWVDPGDLQARMRLAPSPLLVADLCTGSGCIACSLAYEHPDMCGSSRRTSRSEAVALAKENAEASGARRIAWPCWSARSGSGIGEKRMGTFDAVVSNPPYVPTAGAWRSSPARWPTSSPRSLWTAGADGLALFQAPGRLGRPGPEARGRARPASLHEGHMDAAARRGRGRRLHRHAAS